MSAASRSPAEMWLRVVELEVTGQKRVVADLCDPRSISLVEQEWSETGWQTCQGERTISLTPAALDRLIVAVSFR